ncbi:MAG: DUF1439 domain-containing protein [Methylophilaceae bacterium]
MKMRLLAFVLVLLALSGCAMMGDRTVNISQSELQARLNERLAIPFSLLKIFDVTLSNSLVQFDNQTGRMTSSFDTNVSSMLNSEPVAGKLGISGKLRFDPTDNSVKLDDPKIESLNLNGLGGKYGDLLAVLAKQLGGDMLNGITLYTIKPEDLRYGGTQYTPKGLQLTDNNQLQMTFSPVR